jgi:MFS family permease
MIMIFSRFTSDVKISSRRFAMIALLISSVLAWFFLLNIYFLRIFVNFTADASWAYFDQVLFYGFGAFSALMGSSISEKVERRTLIGLWTIFGVLVTTLIPFFSGIPLSLVLSALLGFSLGFGLPSITGFLADVTEVEERGRVAGLIILTTFILTFTGIFVIPLVGSGLLGIALFCTLLRCVGFLPLVSDKCERKAKKESSWVSVALQRNFVLYLIPWLLFNVAAGILDWSSSTLLQTSGLAVTMGSTIGYACTAVSGIVAGLIADRFGRKQPIVAALVLMGISFELLGYAQMFETILIYYTVYGIAWGFLFALYLTIPGDVAHSVSNEKFYALGIASWLIVFMSLDSIPQLFNIGTVPVGLVSPFLGMVIFLSIIPILRAKETLPASKINARKLREHIDKVGKLLEENKE